MPTNIQEILEPKLRFPEFDGKWDNCKVCDKYELISGQHLSPGEYNNSTHGDPYFTGPSDFVDSNNMVTKWTENNGNRAKSSDVLITVKGSGVGKMALLELPKVAMGRQLMAIRGIDGNSRFLFQNFQTKQNLFKALAMGNMIPGLSRGDILNSKLPYPKLDSEADKIACFLSVVDKKISLLKQKHSLMQQYKKGVMQQLFSQRIRFKDDNGKAFPDWQEKSMADVLDQVIREVPKPDDKYLALGIRSHMKGTFQKPDFDPSSNVMDKLYVVKENDLIVNITFAWEGAIAIAKSKDEGGLVSHRFPTYVFKTEQATHEYFKHIIQEKRFKYMLDLISPGGAGRNRVLSKKEFLKLKWDLPDIDEQKKIAKFLGVLDKKVDLVAKQIQLTQIFKKGLLQQMFV